jgi:hypothetical protein
MRKYSIKLRNVDSFRLAEARVDAEIKRKQKVSKRIPNLRDPYGLKSFTLRWFDNINKSIVELLKNNDDGEVKQAKFASRTELSMANDSTSRAKLLEDKEITFSSKGFYGTPLPLIPDIRKSEVSEGVVGQLLEALGVSKKFESIVTLQKGPNKRHNRYLGYQYRRLIKSIDGTLVQGNSDKQAHVIWKYNFYKITSPDGLTDAEKMDILAVNKAKWIPISQHLIQKEEEINLDLELNNLRRNLKKKAKRYWDIAYQLLRCSISFRIAVLQKILGKAGKWFHRNIDIEELFQIFESYQQISDHFDSDMKMKRTWISTQQRNGSWKWRPLGIASYPWRIFTRAINNLLETFISGSWPENQHGYKSGRGVHTAWNQILRTVIYAKYIMEYDFAGFFNTVRMEAVGKTLNRFIIPKPIIAYLINISSADIKNIGSKTRNKYLKTKDPTKQGWASAWYKYEFIHNFRKGYRSQGLPQGFALSPILSVLTLIVLEELKEIDNVMYADDGLFYSDTDKSFLEEAQKVLDKHGIGAYFNKDKCKYVKKDGIWLTNLKFVGLVYNPFDDMLSADTRNGAKLKLKIDAVGYFTDKRITDKTIPVISEVGYSDWNDNNKKLFELYENIYLNTDFSAGVNIHYYEKVEKQIDSIMKDRFLKYSVWDITNLQRESENPIELWNFLFPIRLMRNISKESTRDLIDVYIRWSDSPFPWDIFKRKEITDLFWMNNELTGIEFENLRLKILKDKSENLGENWWERSTIDTMDTNDVEKILENLRWFHQLDKVPDAITPMLKEGELDLGKWLELKLEDINVDELPKLVVEHMKSHGGKMAFTQVTWRNLYMDPIFATFVARLFQDSFRSGIVKQDFRLTTDKTLLTLVKILDKYVGRNSWPKILDGEGLNIFNSSSICSSLLIALAKTWHPHVKSSKAFKIPIFKRTYKKVIDRIANRRSLFLGTLYNEFQLKPIHVETTKKIEDTKRHLRKKYLNSSSLPIEAISRSAISLHEILTEEYGNNIESRSRTAYPYKGVWWDTLVTKKKSS